MKKFIALMVMVLVLFSMTAAVHAEEVQVTQPVQTHEQHKKQKLMYVSYNRFGKNNDIPDGWHVVQMDFNYLDAGTMYVMLVIEEN